MAVEVAVERGTLMPMLLVVVVLCMVRVVEVLVGEVIALAHITEVQVGLGVLMLLTTLVMRV